MIKGDTNREEDMAANHNGQGEDYSPRGAVYAPLDRNKRCAEDDHAGEDSPRYQPREPEALEDLGNLLEEIGSFYLLLRRTPSDVVREAVCEECLRHRDGETAKEEEAKRQCHKTDPNVIVRRWDIQERHPDEVFNEGRHLW